MIGHDPDRSEAAAFVEPLLTEMNSARCVHVEQPHRGASGGSETDDCPTAQLEMIVPSVLTRIEQGEDSASAGSTLVRLGPL